MKDRGFLFIVVFALVFLFSSIVISSAELIIFEVSADDVLMVNNQTVDGGTTRMLDISPGIHKIRLLKNVQYSAPYYLYGKPDKLYQPKNGRLIIKEVLEVKPGMDGETLRFDAIPISNKLIVDARIPHPFGAHRGREKDNNVERGNKLFKFGDGPVRLYNLSSPELSIAWVLTRKKSFMLNAKLFWVYNITYNGQTFTLSGKGEQGSYPGLERKFYFNTSTSGQKIRVITEYKYDNKNMGGRLTLSAEVISK